MTDATRPGYTLAAVATVQFMVSLDLSVANIGLPRITEGLHFDPVGATWVIHAYALFFGGLLLLGGRAADLYGHKRTLLVGLGVFGLASLLGGFAAVPGHLVAARAMQGVGAAALAPAALALLSSTFSEGRARVRAFGIWSAMNAGGAAFGLVLGGVLTEYAGWRWVMFVNVPMAAAALALTCLGVGADGVPARRGRPDVLGAILGTAGTTALVFALVRTDHHGWTSTITLVTLAAAIALLVVFVHVERTTRRDPLIPLGLFTNRSVSGANAFNLLVGATIGSAFYFVSLYLQQVLGNSPAATGLMTLPVAVGVIAGSVVAVKLGYHVAARTLLVAGGLVSASGFAWFGLISADGSFVTDVLGPAVVVGIGFGLCLGPVVSVATSGVATHEMGTASGLLNTSRQIGASLGLAVLGTAAHHRIGTLATPESMNSGYALGFAFGAVLLVVAAVIAFTVLPRTGAPAEPTGDVAPNRRPTKARTS